MTASVDLVPLKLFSTRISEGWTMVPGYPLKPGDWAVTMAPPGYSPDRGSNLSRAACHRNANARRRERETA